MSAGERAEPGGEPATQPLPDPAVVAEIPFAERPAIRNVFAYGTKP